MSRFGKCDLCRRVARIVTVSGGKREQYCNGCANERLGGRVFDYLKLCKGAVLGPNPAVRTRDGSKVGGKRTGKERKYIIDVSKP